MTRSSYDDAAVHYRSNTAAETFRGLTRSFLAAQQRIEHEPDYPGWVGWLVNHAVARKLPFVLAASLSQRPPAEARRDPAFHG